MDSAVLYALVPTLSVWPCISILMFEGNSSDGSYLEEFVKGIVRKEYQVKDHKVWERGLDLQTVNNEIASEMISWYGGFIHTQRFSKIVDNLAVLGSKAKHKLFICAGVKPTSYQSQLMRAYGITIIKLPRKEFSSQWKKLLTTQLLDMGVITYPIYNRNHDSIIGFIKYLKDITEKVWEDRTV